MYRRAVPGRSTRFAPVVPILNPLSRAQDLRLSGAPVAQGGTACPQDVGSRSTRRSTWCPRPDFNRNTPRHVGAARSFRETGETRSPWPDSSTSSVFAPKQGLRASTAPTHSPPAPTRPSCAVSFAFRRSGVASADSPRRTSSQYNGVQPHRAGCRQNAYRVQLVPPSGLEPEYAPTCRGCSILQRDWRNSIALAGFFHLFSFRSKTRASCFDGTDALAASANSPFMRRVVCVPPLRCCLSRFSTSDVIPI